MLTSVSPTTMDGRILHSVITIVYAIHQQLLKYLRRFL